jgi:hypothetical protein
MDAYTTANVGYAVLLGPLQNNGGPTSTMELLHTNTKGINDGYNPSSLLFDQRGGVGFNRQNGAGVDIGAFERTPPVVSSVVFGDGSAQRSMVQQMIVNFNEPVTFTGDVTAAITLSRNGANSSQPGGSGAVTMSALPVSGTTGSVTLTFSGPFTLNGSLIDGFYDLLIDATQISSLSGNLDGNVDGNAGGNYAVTGTTGNKFFRLFGDADGSGVVSLLDFAAFRNVFNVTPSPIFDYHGAGAIPNLIDFAEFRARFNLAP